MKSTGKRGFTLIELLVVIAIIGILSSIVLASLNSARSKGNDASIKANLATIVTQSQLFYETSGNSYASTTATSGYCSWAASMFVVDANVAAALTKTEADNGTPALVCGISPSAFMVSSVLADTTTYYCVDSRGIKKTTTVPPAGGATACL